MKKYSRLLTASHIAFAICISNGDAQDVIVEGRALTVKEPLPVIQTVNGSGVIFPTSFGDSLLAPCSRPTLGKSTEYWSPTFDDIVRAEEIFSQYTRTHRIDGREVHVWPNEPMPDSWPDPKTYRRQYIGVIRGSHKTIYANFIPVSEKLADDWRQAPFSICDGGSSSFGLETDLTSSSVLHVAFDTCMCKVVPANELFQRTRSK